MIAALLALTCGVELWSQKVLTDKGAAAALAPAPMRSSIAALSTLPRSARRRAYIVEGTVALVKHEADSDLHVVVQDGASMMIVEFPDPGCAKGSKAYAAIVRARKQAAKLFVGARVRVTGMAFFDKLHGQTGAARNGVELHPVFRVEAVR